MTTPEQKREALLPCPFCGCEEIDPEGVAYYPGGDKDVGLHHDPACTRCDATTAYEWNTHASLSPTDEVTPAEFAQMIYTGCGELGANHVRHVLKTNNLTITRRK